MRVKFSLLRSNPHIVCEVKLIDTMTAADLCDLVVICFMLESAGNGRVVMADGEHEGKELISDLPLREQMQENEIWMLSLEGYPELRFAVEVLDHESNPDKFPEFLRSRGYCIPMGVRTISELNARLEWQKREFPAADIQNRLKYRFCEEYNQVRMPHWEIAKPLKDVLAKKKKDELKWLCNKYIPYIDLCQNKQPLIDDIMDEYEENGFDWILDLIGLKEYLRMKEICFGSAYAAGIHSDQLPFLSEVGLVCDDGFMGIWIAREFMEYLVSNMQEEHDKQRIRQKAMKAILEYGIEMYVVLPKHIAEVLYQKYYPEHYDKQSFDTQWRKNEADYRKDGFKRYASTVTMPTAMPNAVNKAKNTKVNIDIYYNTHMMDESTMRQFARGVYPYPEQLWYMPDKERFEEIAALGLGFDSSRLEKLRDIFREEYYVNPDRIRSMGNDIYYRIHLNWERDAIIEAALRPIYLFNRKKVVKSLEKFLDDVWVDVTRAQCLGNTLRFWNDVVKGSYYV